MSYLDYIVLFEKYDRQLAFSGNTTRLYLKLLALANSIGWPIEFAKPDPYVAAACGFAPNTMKDCRAQLVARGLLAIVPGGAGRGASTSYQLLGANKVSEFDTLPNNKASNSDTITLDKVSEFDALSPNKESNSDTLTPEITEKVSEKVSNFDTPYIDKENNTSSAASAARGGGVSAEKKPAGTRTKKVGADFAEIAALPLPHAGPEFAKAWQTFYTTNTKQAGKPLTAFELMLKKLGKRPVGFAIVMLESAIQGNWSGVDNPGTSRAFDAWQAEQDRRPPAPTPTAPASYDPAALFGLDSNLTHAQYLARQQQAGQTSTH